MMTYYGHRIHVMEILNIEIVRIIHINTGIITIINDDDGYGHNHRHYRSNRNDNKRRNYVNLKGIIQGIYPLKAHC